MVNLFVIFLTVKRLLELKFSLVCGFKMMGYSRVSSICTGIASLSLVKRRQGLCNFIKNPHSFVSVSLCLVDPKDLCLSK